MRLTSVIAVFFTSLLIITGCKKPATPAPDKFTGCRISQISESGYDTSKKTVYHLYYNSDGTIRYMFVFVSQTPNSNYYRYFTHTGSKIISRLDYAQQSYSQQTDTMNLDAQNRVDRIDHNSYGYYGPNREEYYYDTAGNMYLHNALGYSDVSTDYLAWLNGDPVTDSLVVNGGPINVTYYTYNDTAYNTGNLTAALSDLENYGRAVYTPKHLMVQSHMLSLYDDSLRTYTYNLDAGGRITNRTESVAGSVMNISRIVYECQ